MNSQKPIITLDSIFRELKMGEVSSSWSDIWNKAGEPLPFEQWLVLAEIENACDELQALPELRTAIVKCCDWIKKCEAARRFAWMARYAVFETPSGFCRQIDSWPMPSYKAGDEAELLWAAVLLSQWNYIRQLHLSLEISDEISIATLRDLLLWIERDYDKNRRWGFSEMCWLWEHFTGELYQIGRLQFERCFYPEDYHVFRNRSTGEIITLGGNGMKYREDGLSGEGCNADDVWCASFCEAETSFIGNVIHSTGKAAKEQRTLEKSDWQQVLHKGSPALFVHIPEPGRFHGRFTHESCLASYREAKQFFVSKYPEHKFVALFTSTWLLEGQMREYLKPDSNILRFQSDYHLLPLTGGDERQMFQRLFSKNPEDIATLDDLPQDSSIQRAYLEHIRNGGRWCEGHGFILVDEI